MSIVLVFDADETLWMQEWKYSKAIADFFTYLYSVFGNIMPDFNSLKQRFDEIDRTYFEVWGVDRGRISLVMLKVYWELLKWFESKGHRTISKEEQLMHEKVIFEIGEQPFYFRELEWLEGVREILATFKCRGYKLCLLTCYVPSVWRDKSEFLGVEQYFDTIKNISHRKTKEDFIEVSGWNYSVPSDIKFYTIGNGKSDILPALEISESWHGIYIPHGSTSPLFQQEGEEEPYTPPPLGHPRVITLRSIMELRRVDFKNFLLKGPGE